MKEPSFASDFAMIPIGVCVLVWQITFIVSVHLRGNSGGIRNNLLGVEARVTHKLLKESEIFLSLSLSLSLSLARRVINLHSWLCIITYIIYVLFIVIYARAYTYLHEPAHVTIYIARIFFAGNYELV